MAAGQVVMTLKPPGQWGPQVRGLAVAQMVRPAGRVIRPQYGTAAMVVPAVMAQAIIRVSVAFIPHKLALWLRAMLVLRAQTVGIVRPQLTARPPR